MNDVLQLMKILHLLQGGWSVLKNKQSRRGKSLILEEICFGEEYSMEKLHEKRDEQEMNRAFAVSDFFQLLSLSVQWPEKELAEALLNGSFHNDSVNILEEIGCQDEEIHLIENLFGKLRNQEIGYDLFLKDMMGEYTRLFNHPEQPVISIYESLFTNQSNEKIIMFLNPVALDAERCYREAGLHLTNTSKEPADHMATELEFMMYLYGSKGIALKEQNRERLGRIDERIAEFEEQHLLKWINPFFTLLEEKAEHPAYMAIAKVAKAGLKEVLYKPV